MTENVKNELINLAKSTFEDLDYILFRKMMNKSNHHLRLYLSEKLELYEITFEVNKDNEVLKKQIDMIDKMLDLVINELEINEK